MECHDARILLTFAQRKAEDLDPAERSALQQHLDKCPDCGMMAQADRQADATLAKLMQDVPVPADLRSKIMKRLAAERPARPWKAMAAAAFLALALVGGGGTYLWYVQRPPKVTSDDIGRIISGAESDEKTIEESFKEQNLTIKAPKLMDYRYFTHADVVEFQGRRVAKLNFARTDSPAATASVLILPKAQFRMDDHRDLMEQHVLNTWIRHSDCGGYIFVIFYRGKIERITRGLNG
jgi:hypothetical protein